MPRAQVVALSREWLVRRRELAAVQAGDKGVTPGGVIAAGGVLTPVAATCLLAAAGGLHDRRRHGVQVRGLPRLQAGLIAVPDGKGGKLTLRGRQPFRAAQHSGVRRHDPLNLVAYGGLKQTGGALWKITLDRERAARDVGAEIGV